MRFTICILLIAFSLSACKKEKFESVPQITFKSFSPDVWYYNSLSGTNEGPVMSLQLTDAEGDFGDTSYIYVRNLTTDSMRLDSFKFPNLATLNTKNLNVQVDVILANLIPSIVNPPSTVTDTLFFEIYVKDRANNKSNVITTTDPLFLISE
ncbi:MAG TPA: hypothetical protein PLC48_03990 [Ferruginibacter sp.]|nr:hypothetical protein [Ferruginibacter sp.]